MQFKQENMKAGKQEDEQNTPDLSSDAFFLFSFLHVFLFILARFNA
jgi:hypothetical protein